MVGEDEVVEALLGAGLPPWRLAFAYGSGVLPQATRRSDEAMLDVILVVDDPVAWHSENLARHGWHYSFPSRRLGASAVARLQSAGPGVYFNTLIPTSLGAWRHLKYGVTSTVALLDDLRTWRWLYVAGRLHKPVVVLGERDDDLVADASRANLASALATALVLLPTTFDAHALFSTIASLSYEGDVRFAVGAEDPRKIDNIVSPNLARFEALFAPALEAAAADGLLVRRGLAFEQSHRTTLRMLPAGLGLGRLEPDLLRGALRRVVRRSSLVQTAKGLLTAGPARSLVYVAAKLGKGGWR